MVNEATIGLVIGFFILGIMLVGGIWAYVTENNQWNRGISPYDGSYWMDHTIGHSSLIAFGNFEKQFIDASGNNLTVSWVTDKRVEKDRAKLGLPRIYQEPK